MGVYPPLMPSAMKIGDSVRRHTVAVAKELHPNVSVKTRRVTIQHGVVGQVTFQRGVRMQQNMLRRVSVKTMSAGDSLATKPVEKDPKPCGKCGQAVRPRDFQTWYAAHNLELSKHNSACTSET